MKKLVALLLSLSLVLSLSTTVFAADYSGTKEIENVNVIDTSFARIAESHDETATYRTILNKEANTIQMIVFYNDGSVVYGSEIEIPSSSEAQSLSRAIMRSQSASLNENTFCNYEYTITYGTSNKWELRRPDGSFGTYYFQTYETSLNESYLTKFRGYVDSINEIEGAIIRNFGLYALSCLVAGATGAGAIFSGGTLSTAAWGSLVAVAGCGDAVLTECTKLDTACKNAYDSYWNAYYNSTIL